MPARTRSTSVTLERAVEHGKRQLFEPRARAYPPGVADSAARIALSTAATSASVLEIDPEPVSLSSCQRADSAIERHDDRWLAGVEVAKRADDR